MDKPKGVIEQRLAFIRGSKFIVRAVNKHCVDPIEILGIDPARGSTGWCYRNCGGIIKTGAIASSSYGFSRIIRIENQLRKMLNGKCPFVAIEGYAMNAKWGRELAGEVGGVIRRLLYYKHRPLLVISPLTIKAWVKAKSKDQVMLEILDQYKIKITNNDAADAFIIQEVGHKAVLMAQAVVKSKIKDPEEIRLFLKNKDYESTEGLKGLFRYQENSLFKMIYSQGSQVEFFLKAKPELGEF